MRLGGLVIRFHHGSAVGIRAVRRHLDGYIAERPSGAALRPRLIRAADPGRLPAGIAELARAA